MLEVIVATKNLGKLKEIKDVCPNISFKSLFDIDFKDEIVEDGTTFKENALIKAKAISTKCNKIILADDSGLSVRALNYQPGIYSARFSKEHDDKSNNELLIKKLQGISDRYAFYTCAMCLCIPGKEPIFVEEICEGEIVDTPRGNGGFGYDPHFYLENLGKCMAELTTEEKNAISHRGKAIRKIAEILNSL